MGEEGSHSSHHGIPEAQDQELAHNSIRNVPASGIPYFTPRQSPVSLTWEDQIPEVKGTFSDIGEACRYCLGPAA